MTDVPTGGPLGEREATLRIIYNDQDDLEAKLQAVTNGVKAGGEIIYNHPLWLADAEFNCCGGSPP